MKQTPVSDYDMNYDTESVDVEKIEDDLLEGFWIIQDIGEILVWRENDYIFELTIYMNSDVELSKTTAILVAKSVRKVES